MLLRHWREVMVVGSRDADLVKRMLDDWQGNVLALVTFRGQEHQAVAFRFRALGQRALRAWSGFALRHLRARATGLALAESAGPGLPSTSRTGLWRVVCSP